MTARYYPNLRRTEQRQKQFQRIKEATGIEGFSSAVDYALARVIAEFDLNAASPVVIDLLDRLDQLEQAG